MLHFVQQFRIINEISKKMLYFGQDYLIVIRPSPQPAVELAKSLQQQCENFNIHYGEWRTRIIVNYQSHTKTEHPA